MSKEPGTQVLLYVSSGSPTDFNLVGGQQNTTWEPGVVTDDVTDKGNSGWGSQLAVLKNGVVNCEGVADWPDTLGLGVVKAAFNSNPPADVEGKIVLNQAGENYVGLWQVTAFSITGGHQTATRYSFTLSNNGPLAYSAT